MFWSLVLCNVNASKTPSFFTISRHHNIRRASLRKLKVKPSSSTWIATSMAWKNATEQKASQSSRHTWTAPSTVWLKPNILSFWCRFKTQTEHSKLTAESSTFHLSARLETIWVSVQPSHSSCLINTKAIVHMRIKLLNINMLPRSSFDIDLSADHKNSMTRTDKHEHANNEYILTIALPVSFI